VRELFLTGFFIENGLTFLEVFLFIVYKFSGISSINTGYSDFLIFFLHGTLYILNLRECKLSPSAKNNGKFNFLRIKLN